MAEFEQLLDLDVKENVEALAAATFELLQRFELASEAEIKERKSAAAKRDKQAAQYPMLVHDFFRKLLSDPFCPPDANKVATEVVMDEFNAKQKAEKEALGIGPKIKQPKMLDDGEVGDEYLEDGCKGTNAAGRAAAEEEVIEEVLSDEELRKRDAEEAKQRAIEAEAERIREEQLKEAEERRRKFREEQEKKMEERKRTAVANQVPEGFVELKRDDEDELMAGFGGKGAKKGAKAKGKK